MDSTVYVEVMTLRVGLLVAAASQWGSSHSFVFEYDSKPVVAWVVDHSSACCQFHNLLYECCNVF